ncbi:rsmB, partial [Symbiodinium pilosum]
IDIPLCAAMSTLIDGERFEFPFAVRRNSDEDVGIHYKPVFRTDESFCGFEVTSVLYTAERKNQVLRRFNMQELQKQMLCPGDIIVSVNGKKSQELMMTQLQASPTLFMKVWRDKVKEDTEPVMYAISEYDPSIEAEGGYLKVSRRSQIRVDLNTRAPPEDVNAYRCDYIW